MNLPNKLTVLRIIMVPFFIAAYMEKWFFVAFALFIVASLTDMLDGKIARARNLVTNFGKIMDPLADKNPGVFRIVPVRGKRDHSGLDADYHSGAGICCFRNAHCGGIRGNRYCCGHER